MENDQNLISILPQLWKWKKHIVFLCALVVTGTIVLSLMLPNYYQASTLFYAASQDLAKPAPVGNNNRNLNYFGQDADLDRLFSIANSNEVKNYLIEEFDLFAHYEIDDSVKNAEYKLKKKLGGLYKTLKTKFDALELIVEDKDPEMAAKMANSARDKTSEIARNLIKSTQKSILDALEKNIEQKKNQLNVLNDTLFNIKSKYNIYDLRNQGDVLVTQKTIASSKLKQTQAKIKIMQDHDQFRDSIQYLKALEGGYSAQVSLLNNELSKFNIGYNPVLSLNLQRDHLNEQLSLDIERKKQLSSVYLSDFPSLHIVEKAVPPIHKSRPKRSLYVLGSGLFAFIFGCLAVLMLESLKSINWKEAFHES